MKARIDLMHVNPGVIHAMLGLERQVRQAGLDSKLLDQTLQDFAPYRDAR